MEVFDSLFSVEVLFAHESDSKNEDDKSPDTKSVGKGNPDVVIGHGEKKSSDSKEHTSVDSGFAVVIVNSFADDGDFVHLV